MIRITPYGAAGEVTGSSYLVETGAARVLVDLGAFQGSPLADRRNRRPLPFDPKSLDAVVVTHAHLDHTGRLPLLAKHGRRATVHMTPPSRDLTRLILLDSAHLQASDAEWRSRQLRRAGRPPVEPIYTAEHVEQLLEWVQTLPYGEDREIADGVSIRFVNAGHILGAASVRMTIRAGGAERVIVFSGDLGPKGQPILRDAVRFDHADLTFLESTYGDRDHRSRAETVGQFADIIRGCAWEKEKVLIPSFAIGRSQELLYHLGTLQREHDAPRVPVILDSPMAIEATELYRKCHALYDREALRLIEAGHSPLSIPDLRYSRTSEDSRNLNDMWGAAVIIAGSGMCTGGRIVHHLKHNAWRRNVSIVFVGYQADGTLGRRLVQGAKRVRIRGEWVAVRATIHTLGGFSAHAGQSELIDWVEPLARAGSRIALTHGENGPRRALAAALRERFGDDPALPEFAQTITLD